MNTEAQRSKFIADGRNAAKVFSALAAFDAEYDATSAGTVITDADFTGINEGLTAADMVNFQVIVKAVLAEFASVAGRETIIQNYKNV